jgi:4-amino-4-deoxychorismate lyase
MKNSCEELGIRFEVSVEVLKRWVLELVEKENKKFIAVKINVYKNGLKSDIIITTREIPYGEEDYKVGISIGIAKGRRNPYSTLVYHKSSSYAENYIEREIGKKDGFNEIIFLNVDGYISEGSMSNVFFVKDGVVFTPPVSCGILNGIIRQKVIAVCEDNDIEVRENFLKLNEFKKWDEIFITNSLLKVMKVNNFNGIRFDISSCTLSEKIKRKIEEM